MRAFCTFLIAAICVFLAGCVSSTIDRRSSKYRDMFEPSTTRAMFRSKLGAPLQSWQIGSGSVPQYKDKEAFAYDTFAVRGKIAKPGDGAAQATVNAISLGSMEAIMIPVTVVSAIGASTQEHTLVVFYDSNLRYHRHELFDKHGRKEDVLGY